MRLVDKCVLKVFGQEVKEACSTEQMCGGMVAGFEDGIHAMRLLCQEKSKEEDWGFLLIDARNTFNEDNMLEMLWDV